jgi:hypothetical protein
VIKPLSVYLSWVIVPQAGAPRRSSLARPLQSSPPMQSEPPFDEALEFCPREREVAGRSASSVSHGHTRGAAPIPSPTETPLRTHERL